MQSENLKPIEPGCLAVIVKAGDYMVRSEVGKFVKVVELVSRMPNAPKLDANDWWLVEEDINYADSQGHARVPAVREIYLMRIDPDQGQFDEEENEKNLTTEA